jgi:DUF4097 and DUF4098 domain-containing protein YvlB
MNSRIARASWITIGMLALAIPTFAGSRIEKTLALNPGGRFVLDSESGSVSVTGSNEPGAKVVITSNRDDLQDRFDFSFDEKPGVVRVLARQHQHFHFLSFDNLNLHFEVRVPKETILNIKTAGGGIEINSMGSEADLETSGGPITVSGLTGRLGAHTSGGGIRVQETKGDSELRTSGGGIEVDSVDGSLVARTSGGSIHIQRVTGRVDAHTSGGGITAVLSKKNAHGGVLETSGGSISVAIDPAANLEIDASTSGGSVQTDLPIRVVGTISRHGLRGTMGSGGETLRLRTSGGSIHLRPL